MDLSLAKKKKRGKNIMNKCKKLGKKITMIELVLLKIMITLFLAFTIATLTFVFFDNARIMEHFKMYAMVFVLLVICFYAKFTLEIKKLRYRE